MRCEIHCWQDTQQHKVRLKQLGVLKSGHLTKHKVKFKKSSTQVGLYEPDLFFMYPKNLIIGCDVVDDTIFGGEHVKLLRLVTNNIHVDGDILSFDFLQNEYVNLNVKEFKSIKIAILDASGGPVKTETTFPTRLQLMFNTV